MFKSDRIMLILLIGICLIISVVLLDAVMDPVFLVRTVYARITNSPDPVRDEVFIPDMEAESIEAIVSETSPGLQEGWDWYRNEGFAFEIQYPKGVVSKSVLDKAVLNYGVGVDPDTPVWEFRLNNSEFYQGTNLVDASILVHVLEGKEQEAYCSAFKPGSIYQTPNDYRESLLETEINGVPFLKDEVIEGVMGEFYRRISYRTFSRGACYELTQLMHYQNISGFSGGEVSEFDQERVIGELDKVLNTFSFLDVEPTFPAQSYPVPKTLSTAVSKATSENVDGIDVSHWQGDIGWNKVYNAGYVFAFAKGTEGVGWTDVMFHNNMAEGDNAGVYMGVYHFARPDLGNSAAAEANYFLDVAGEYLKSGYLRPVLDLEVGTSLGKTALSNWVRVWMETVENRTGISPLLYTNPNFINYYLNDTLTGYDLWIAHWTCEPEPSYNVPNTGSWRDWAFWQYYGPGGCGGNAGYVPGISTNIDLNIFNGVEAGLEEFDALSLLWVSLTSDAYYVPAPYYADMTGNVNGDTTGLIDFAFWWNCSSLESDLAAVEAACGALADPAEGECEYNSVGLRCIGMENELQLAEHTYQEIGNYTAKVIVERGGEAPVEDRYKITTYNPIRSTVLTPSPAENGYVDEPYSLRASVTLHTSVAGALQVSITDQLSAEVEGETCIPVVSDNESVEKFDFTLQNNAVGEKFYVIDTRYRPLGSCPITDEDENDRTQTYHITWIDERAVLEIRDSAGETILPGSAVDLGGIEPFQALAETYYAYNPSAVTGLQITSIEVENAVNVANLQVDPSENIDVGPGEEIPLDASFEVGSSGPFSFDVVINHDASNPTPIRYTLEGYGVLGDNPIQSVGSRPVSPGSSLVGEDFGLSVDVDLDAPVAGPLQVSIVKGDQNPVQPPVCLEITDPGQALHSFDFSWTETESGLVDYQIWVRYRDQGVCPIEESGEYDISQGYQVEWLEDSPLLVLKTSDEIELAAGGSEDLGEIEVYQSQSQQYFISNPSSTNEFQVTAVSFADAVNLIALDVVTSLPISIAPGAEIPLEIEFEVEDPGDFSFEVNLDHDASNPTPFSFSVNGSGLLTSNPIQNITPEPLSPGEILIGEVFGLSVDVAYDAPVAGALVISLLDSDGSPFQGPACQEIAELGAGTATADFSWSESGVVLNDYTIWGGFYSREGCPAAGEPVGQLSMQYQVDWQEELPFLEFVNIDGTLIPSGETINLGQFEYYQNVDLSYVVRNTSSTSDLEISDIRIENLSNLSKADSNPEDGLVLEPEGESPLDISFQADNTGSFSFDLVIDHLASNQSPFRITFQGTVIMTNNPVKFIVPTPPSPGTSLIGNDFSLRVEVGMDAPDVGALQLSIIDKAADQVVNKECRSIDNNLDQARTFNLSWTRSVPGSREYTILAQYRAQGDCPIVGTDDSDLTQVYKVNWTEDIPELALEAESGTAISPGEVIDLGQQPYFEQIDLVYVLSNTSTTSSMQIAEIRVENTVNGVEAAVNPASSLILGPGEEKQVTVSFQVTEFGPFSFDLVLDHDASNSNPYSFTLNGSGALVENPIYQMTLIPVSPASLFISEIFELQVQAEINPPAAGVMEVIVYEEPSRAIIGSTCLAVLGEHSLLNVDLSWTETSPGDVLYSIQLGYHAGSSCPTSGDADAVAEDNYQISWQTHEPVLIVNRPEGVTIFDGMTDYVGEHDFFRFVEVTYVIENHNEAAPLIITEILVDNLENLREVLIEPATPIEIGPGGSREIKINFQMLMLDSFSFDLVWDHNGSNANPYTTRIEGTSNLNLGDGVPQESWLYKFLDSLIRTGFFLKLPPFFTGN